MAICNQGEGTATHPRIDVFKIDPSLVSTKIIEEISENNDINAASGQKYFYSTLPKKLSKGQEIEKDSLCNSFLSIAPKSNTSCSLSCIKAAIRFAWPLLLSGNTKASTFRNETLYRLDSSSISYQDFSREEFLTR